MRVAGVLDGILPHRRKWNNGYRHSAHGFRPAERREPMAESRYLTFKEAAMRNHKNLTFWEDLVRCLVRSYRFAMSLPGNDQFTLGTEIKRLAVRVRTKIVAGAATETAVGCAHEFDGAYQGLKEISSSIEFAVELGITKPELVADLLETLDRLAGAVFSYRRTLAES